LRPSAEPAGTSAHRGDRVRTQHDRAKTQRKRHFIVVRIQIIDERLPITDVQGEQIEAELSPELQTRSTPDPDSPLPLLLVMMLILLLPYCPSEAAAVR
jgi:hypothetical protein